MKKIIKLFVKQIIVTIIFSIILTGMHFSKNPTISSYSASLGRAIRYDLSRAVFK